MEKDSKLKEGGNETSDDAKADLEARWALIEALKVEAWVTSMESEYPKCGIERDLVISLNMAFWRTVNGTEWSVAAGEGLVVVVCDVGGFDKDDAEEEASIKA